MPQKRTRRTIDSSAPIRAVVYVRLSKEKSSKNDTEVGLETQQAGCERATAALGGEVVGVERDVVSGDRLDRPGLWRDVDRVKAGEANALIVYALDRLGRDQVQQAVVLLELRRAGARLLSATENLEDGPMGDFLRSVYTFAGALELTKIRERTSRALHAKFPEQGRYKPGRRVVYGYRQIGKGADATFAIDDAEATVVERIFRERASGKSLRAIVDALDADRIPSPTGKRWSSGAVSDILDRPVYWTGEHECWKTRTVRDADGVPYLEARPADERYTVPFPFIVAPELADRARAAAERNRWRSRRNDRPAERGVLRYGFARCASCGRALSVLDRGGRQLRYACTNAGNHRHPCPAPAAVAVDRIDPLVWNWVRGVLEDPEQAAAYLVVDDAAPDPAARAALAEAERRVAGLEAAVDGLIGNLGLLTGAAAALAAEKANAMNGEIGAARAERDRLVAVAAAKASPRRAAFDLDAATRATVEALRAMQSSDPDAGTTATLAAENRLRASVTVPDTWKARQAALSALDVSVVVSPEKSDRPRWVAEMRFGDGGGVRAWPDPRWESPLSITHSKRHVGSDYLSSTRRSTRP